MSICTPLSICAPSSVGHAQGIPGKETGRLPPTAAEPDGCADVHADTADTAITRAAAAPATAATRAGVGPRPRHDRGPAIGFPADPALAHIGTSMPAGNGGAAAVQVRLFYSL